MSGNIIKLLWITYRNPKYKGFGWLPITRFDNVRRLAELASEAETTSAIASALAQAAYRMRKPHGVTMAQALDRLILNVKAGSHIYNLAEFYGVDYQTLLTMKETGLCRCNNH